MAVSEVMATTKTAVGALVDFVAAVVMMVMRKIGIVMMVRRMMVVVL